jgi:preprotein translocase subunit YajC
MIGVFIVVFYFLLWRPDRKRRKDMEAKRGALKKGDKVTAMGLIGNVFKVNDNTVILKMYDGAKVEILKGAITDVQPGTGEPDKDEKAEG